MDLMGDRFFSRNEHDRRCSRTNIEEKGVYSFLLAPPVDFTVAYFSKEIGITESIPIYSVVAGHIAGDHLKSASDLNLPLSGVGLLYKHGYCHPLPELGRLAAEESSNNDIYHISLVLSSAKTAKPINVSVRLAELECLARSGAPVGRVSLTFSHQHHGETPRREERTVGCTP
jgi:starch phosphorylase